MNTSPGRASPERAIPDAEFTLTELALLFLRLGLTAFGGPAAHIAMMEDEVVERRGWLTQSEFLDLLGAANLIPGPSSTELAIYIGYRMAGWRGLLLAGICFIAPAFVMVMAIAWAYVRYSQLPQSKGILYGVKPVVIAIVVHALWHLGRSALKSHLLAAIALLATVLAFFGINPLFIIFGSGGVVAVQRWFAHKGPGSNKAALDLLLLTVVLVALPLGLSRYASTRTSLELPSLFLVFLKLGSVVYGSGYVLLAFLRNDLVTHRGWLTSAQLLDSIAVGQVTPGPVFTTATFIGYLLLGPRGAVVATLGMFIPAFVFTAIIGSLIPRLRGSPVSSGFLDGVGVAALALMAAVLWQLGTAALIDMVTVGLALVSAILLFRFRFNAAWLVLGGAAIGLAVQVMLYGHHAIVVAR